MATITTRSGKGAALTHQEVDANFTGLNTELGQKELASNKGVANGYASLDAAGKVPSAQLPSYVDDVVEAANLASLPGTGETGKIYVTLDTNKTYRWSGSAYVEISPSPGSTDSLAEGSTNLYFTQARARASVSASGSLSYNSSTGVFSFSDAVTSVAGRTGAVTLTSSDVGLGNVENKSSATIRGELTSGNVTTALGFTPYNSSNPSGYITSSSNITGNAATATTASQLNGYFSSSYSGPTSAVKQFFWESLTASGTQARTFEIARLGIDYNDWNTGIGPFEVELYEAYYSRGLKKKYVIHWGYSNVYGMQLVEYSGSGDNNFQARIGTPVQVSGDNYYLPVFVDVGYYSHVDVRVTTNREITASNPPGIGATYINASPSATNIANFSPDSTVNFASTTAVQIGGNQLLHAGNYGSYALPLGGGTVTGNLFVTGIIRSTSGVFQLNDGASTGGGLYFYKTITGSGTSLAPSLFAETGLPLYFMNNGSATPKMTLNTSGELSVTSKIYVGGATVNSGYNGIYGTNMVGAASGNKLVYFFNDGSTIKVDAYDYGASSPLGFTIGGNGGTVNLYTGATVSGNTILHAGNYSSYALPLSGGTMTGTLSFQQPVGLSFANGQYIKDNGGGGLVIYSGAAVNINHASGLTSNGNTILHAGNYASGYLNGTYLRAAGHPGYGNWDTFGNTSQTVHEIYQENFNAGTNTGSSNFPSQRSYSYGALMNFHAGTARAQIYISHAGNDLIYRGGWGTAGWWTWNKVLSDQNYTSYAPSLTGSGASGTWGINVTGGANVLFLQSLGSGSVNVNQGSTTVYRTDTGNGSAVFYAPVLHVGGGDTMWQAQGTYGSSGNGTLYFRQGYAGSWGNWLTMLSSANYSSYALPLSGGTMSGLMYGVGFVPVGVSGNSNVTSDYYKWGYQEAGAWTHPFPDLVIAYHTGMKFGANTGYGGMRFYSDHPHVSSTELFSIGNGDSHVRVANNLYVGGNLALHAANYNSYSPTLTGGGASGTWSINVTGSAGSVSWANISAGVRSEYGNLQFQPAPSSFSGMRFLDSGGGGAGWFLIRGTSDTDVYTAEGITLVADRGWLTLAQRETAGRGVRIMSGTTSTERIKVTTAGDIQFVNGNSFTYGGNAILHAGNYGSYALPLSGGTLTGTIYSNAASIIIGQQGGSTRGFLYNDSAGMGFLTSGGSWAAYVPLGTNNWQVNGSITASGNVTAYSDERVKANWRRLDDGFVVKLASVKSGIYDRTDIDLTQAGVSAQSLRNVLPQTVMESSDGELSVAYGNAALVSAVELAKELVALKHKVAELEARVH